ncbi:hypothetical protein CFBP3840_P200016 (plasmid) [Pseudomonas syringae]|uniref:Uncharacterized protein n=1 Tax=Pseudomonas syringae TaxID=317 RepID=A0A2K4X3K8_PSESX|nr:hypothetical protein CFBP3840_P200016 [Pseudomonas syringae]
MLDFYPYSFNLKTLPWPRYLCMRRFRCVSKDQGDRPSGGRLRKRILKYVKLISIVVRVEIFLFRYQRYPGDVPIHASPD